MRDMASSQFFRVFIDASFLHKLENLCKKLRAVLFEDDEVSGVVNEHVPFGGSMLAVMKAMRRSVPPRG